MKKRSTYKNTALIYGLTFISPVVYSVTLMELDSLQKIYFLCASILVYIFIIHKSDSQSILFFDRKLLLLLFIFPLTFLTAFFNGSQSGLILQFSNLLILYCIALFTAIIFSIRGEDSVFKTISRSVVIISTFFSLIGLMQVFEFENIPIPNIIPPGSTLGHRGFASEYLLSSLPFFLIFNNFIKKDYKPILFIAGFINLSFLFFTRSRSGMVILAIILAIHSIFLYRQKISHGFRKVIPVVSVIIGAFIFSLLPVKGVERPDFGPVAKSYLDSDFKSNRLRLNFWEASIQMINENPLTGVGLFKWSGYYPNYFGGYFEDKNVSHVHNIHAHNDYLELFAENGIAASLSYIVLLIIVLYSLLQKSRFNENYFYIFFVVLILALFSLISFPIHKFSSYFLFAVSLGIALMGDKRENINAIKVKLYPLKFILTIALFAGLTTSYTRLKSEVSFIESINYKNQKAYSMMLEKLNEVSPIFYFYDPAKQPIEYYCGIANYYLNRYEENLNCVLQANEFAPFNPIVLNNVAAAYLSVGELNSAVITYEKLKVLFPNYIKPQINLLKVYAELKFINKGNLLLDELKRKAPGNPYLMQVQNQYYISN